MTTAGAFVPRPLSAFVLAATLAVAGVMHFLLTAEHMAVSALFGVAFLSAGIAQFGMAALAVIRPSRLLYAAVVASTVVFGSAYAYNVMVGLPFHHEPGTERTVDGEAGDASHDEAHPHGNPTDDGAGRHEGETAAAHADKSAQTTDLHAQGATGTGEPVDEYGVITQVAQFSAAAIALVLLLRKRRPSP